MPEPVILIQVFRPRRDRRPLTRAMRWAAVATVSAILAASALVAAVDYGLGAVVAVRDAAQ